MFRYLLFFVLIWISFSCTFLLGKKSKEIKVFIENDSLELITAQKQALSSSPFTLLVQMKEPKIEFKAVYRDEPRDTFYISHKRRLKDILYWESLSFFPWTLAYGYYMAYQEPKGLAYTYPDRLYVDVSDRKKPISLWPRKRSGWTRLHTGFTVYNSVLMKGAEENYDVVGPFGIYGGMEHFVSDKYMLSAETGIFLGGDTRSNSVDITDTSRVFRLNFRQLNTVFSRQITRRLSVGLGLSLHQTRFHLEKRDTSTATKTFVTVRRIERNTVSPILRVNYFLRPNSSIQFSYLPVLGRNGGHVFHLGFSINFHLFQPSRYRVRFDDRMGSDFVR